mmetsp:Transcript_4236/g.17184  ORF Transcript_4236/g.17184 Transcript_4236/m.17184 type:complete len:433 (+) Transcript_4236:457-1755(+)
MPERERAALRVDLGDVHDADFGVAAGEVLLGERVGGHGGEVREDLPREGLVHLDDVDVLLEREPVPEQQLRRRVRRAEQQFLERIDGCERKVDESSLGRQTELERFRFVHDDARGRAVREKRRVRRGVRALGPLDERGFQLGELLGRRDADAVLVERVRRLLRFLRRSRLLPRGGSRDELLGVEAVVVGLPRERVRAHAVLVLRGARDAELGRQPIRRVAHDLARREVGDLRRLGRQVFGLQPLEQRHGAAQHALLHRRLGADEAFPHGPRVSDGRVREGLAAAGDDDVGLPREDLLGALTNRRIRRHARHRHRVRGHALGNSSVHRGLASDVRRPRFLDDRAPEHVVHERRVEAELRHEAGQRGAREVDGEAVVIDGRGQRERNADAVDEDHVALLRCGRQRTPLLASRAHQREPLAGAGEHLLNSATLCL